MHNIAKQRPLNGRASKPQTTSHCVPSSLRNSSVLLLCLSSACLIAGCDTHSPTSSSSFTQELPSQAEAIAKSANLYKVEDYLFRSEQLRQADLSLIHANHIDAIISLRFFGQDDDQELLQDMAENSKVALYNQPLKSWHVTPLEVAEVLHKIETLQAKNQHVLIHCYHGADRTGLIIAMHRIIHQGWSIKQAHAEMTQGGFGYHRIWVNLENMLNPATVTAVRTQLALLKQTEKS